MTIPIIGHRGCPLHEPENSLAGIRKAAELGADGVEIDVRRTLDSIPVVFHDWSLRRMTGWPGPVRLYPFSLLRRMRLRDSDEPIPTLADALAVLPEGLFTTIDLKDAGAARPTLRLIRERGLEGRVLLSSYQERVIRYFVRAAPEIDRVFARDDVDPEGLRHYLEHAQAIGARSVSPHWDAVNPQFVGEAHDRGLRVYSMNRDLKTVVKKAAAGLDGIITDYPREVRAILEAAAS